MEFIKNTTKTTQASDKSINIMIVDDNNNVTASLKRRFDGKQFDRESIYNVICANSKRDAIDKIEGNSILFDLFLIDIRMETDDAGLTLIEYIRRKEKFVFVPIVVITGQPGDYTEESIRKKYLIHGYINKSEDIDILEEIRKILTEYKHSQKNRNKKIKFRSQIEKEMGSSPEIQRVFDIVEDCCRVKNPVIFIEGETGTGKSLIARYFHNINNENGAFEDINCSESIGADANIFKSQIFGCTPGFIRELPKGKDGLLKATENGTLFLDEFQNIHLDIQSLLIKVIENKEYKPLGSEKSVRANVNFIIAGNKNIKELVKKGLIRDDLYYRITHFINIPPLRERKNDIPYFIDKFLTDSNREYKKFVSISEKAKDQLIHYYWPGNVRQLKNTIAQAVLNCRSHEITTHDFYLEDEFQDMVENEKIVVTSNFYNDLKYLIQQYIKINNDIIQAKNPKDREVLFDFDQISITILNCIMESTGNNKKATAELLGLSVEKLATLLRKIE